MTNLFNYTIEELEKLFLAFQSFNDFKFETEQISDFWQNFEREGGM